jgi:hypothetical protein
MDHIIQTEAADLATSMAVQFTVICPNDLDHPHFLNIYDDSAWCDCCGALLTSLMMEAAIRAWRTKHPEPVRATTCTCCTDGGFNPGLNPNLCQNCFHDRTAHAGQMMLIAKPEPVAAELEPTDDGLADYWTRQEDHLYDLEPDDSEESTETLMIKYGKYSEHR